MKQSLNLQASFREVSKMVKFYANRNGAVEKGTKLYSLSRGKEVRNLATMRLNDEIWMYIGRDSKGREKWICADTGNISYVK